MRRVIAALVVVASLPLVGLAAPTAASAAPRGVDRHVVSFVLGVPPGATPDASTVADARAVIADVDAFYRTVSKGRIRFVAGKVVSWTKASSRCSLSSVSAAARAHGLRIGAKRHVVMYQPVDCGFAGRADTGGRRVILASRATSNALAHELGHNLGLGHSSASGCSVAFVRECSPRKDARRLDEYGDDSDLMGGSDRVLDEKLTSDFVDGTLGPVHLKALGLLGKSHIRTVKPAKLRRPKTLTLTPRELGTGVQAVSLPWSGRRLLVSYARPAEDATNGRLLVQTPMTGSLLLPVSAAGDFSGPLAGSTYRVGRKVVMEVVSTSATSAVLRFRRVTKATPTSVRSAPGVRGATVIWRATSVPGLTGYEVRMVAAPVKAGEPPQVVTVAAGAGQRRVDVSGLASGSVWRAQVIPLVAGAAAPAGVGAAVRPQPDPAMLPTFPVVDLQPGNVRVQWQQPSNPAVVVANMTVTARVDTSAGWSSRTSGGPDEISVTYQGHGTLTVTAEATYASGETYRVVLRRNIKV